MKKYPRIAELTKQYLEGNLEKLTIEYDKHDTFIIKVLYEDPYDFKFDYDIELNSKKRDFSFLGHHSMSVLHRINLDRDKQFEHALTNYLFSTI